MRNAFLAKWNKISFYDKNGEQEEFQVFSIIL